MLSGTSFKRELKHYAILALAILGLQGFISNFISPYLSFLTKLGTFGSYILSFIVLLIIIIPTDMILQRTI